MCGKYVKLCGAYVNICACSKEILFSMRMHGHVNVHENKIRKKYPGNQYANVRACMSECACVCRQYVNVCACMCF